MNANSLRRANFDSFDPRQQSAVTQKWDNATGGGVSGTRPGQKMQIGITLSNPTAQVLSFELFNYLQSFLKIKNSAYAVGHYLYAPLSAIEGINAAITAGKVVNAVGFTDAGDLSITGNDGDPAAKVMCNEMPYRSLFEASAAVPFNVQYFRMTVTQDGQIDQTLIYFQRSFSGGHVQNNINPRSYFLPNQYQGKVIDVNTGFSIGADSGIVVKVLAGETVKLNLFIDAWSTATLVAS